MWSANKKRDVDAGRLLVQRAKFSPLIEVSAGVCYNGEEKLHFFDEKVKINVAYYTGNLLPKQTEDCHNLLQNNFIFQQDGTPAHIARLAQDWINQTLQSS